MYLLELQVKKKERKGNIVMSSFANFQLTFISSLKVESFRDEITSSHTQADLF